MMFNPLPVLARVAAISWLGLGPGLAVMVPARAAAPEMVPAARALEQTIDQGRTGLGRTPLQSLPEPLQQANRAYGEAVLQQLLEHCGCDHDLGQWQGFQRRMEATGGLAPMTEVLACPRSREGWSARDVVNRWQVSSLHNRILFERDNRSHIGCIVAEQQNSMAALCTLWTKIR